MMLDAGLVLMSDTRTNSGVDNISVFRKMYHCSVPGERIIALMTAGNLATTQAVISQVEERNKTPEERHNSLLEAPTMCLIYPEGNFIEASFDTPFFQIGETKYGRPIILRGYDRTMSFEDAVKLLMVSFDSTLKANLSVGLPLDLLVIDRDTYVPTHARRITGDDPYFRSISSGWGEALKKAFLSLPPYSFGPEPESETELETAERIT